MARSVLADAGFVVALLNRRDARHEWAKSQAERLPPPWKTCDAALSEAFHLLGSRGEAPLRELLRRRALVPSFDFAAEMEPVLKLLERYAGMPMGLADACLVRMTEKTANVVLLTTGADFRVYRRHGRQVVPCVLPL